MQVTAAACWSFRLFLRSRMLSEDWYTWTLWVRGAHLGQVLKAHNSQEPPLCCSCLRHQEPTAPLGELPGLQAPLPGWQDPKPSRSGTHRTFQSRELQALCPYQPSSVPSHTELW